MLPTYHCVTRDIVSPYLGQHTTFDFDVANPALERLQQQDEDIPSLLCHFDDYRGYWLHGGCDAVV